MADDPQSFDEAFSTLTNNLQVALDLARAHAVHARQGVEAADAVYQSLVRAVDAANAMRPERRRER